MTLTKTLPLCLGLLTLGACDTSLSVSQDTGASQIALQATQLPYGPELPSPLVPLDWWMDHRKDPGLVLIDARSGQDYAANHLPGAIHLHYEETYDAVDHRHWKVASLPAINRLFSSKGITTSQTIVIYGTSEDFRSSARLFWVFELFGHPSVGVLNGNTGTFLAHGGELESDPSVLPPSRFVGELDPRRLATKLEVKQALRDDSVVLLDTRSRDQFTGQNGWEGLEHWGRIPGALNMPPESLYKSEGGGCELPRMDEIPSIYQEVGGNSLITYCNAGHEATVSYLLFRSIGVSAAVYDGSWIEWSSDPGLPRAKGDQENLPTEGRIDG